MPSLELCLKIPSEAFTDTTMMWRWSDIDQKYFLFRRGWPPVYTSPCPCGYKYSYPAPNVEEIVDSLARLDGFSGATLQYAVIDGVGRWKATGITNDVEDNDDPSEYHIAYADTQANAALKLWFKWRNIKC